MHINKYLIIIIFLLSILIVASCKLLSPDDTTPPEIQLTIAGDVTEISRGVTLYLDIEDDSEIDYVSVIIDDTTAITVESNFDTIRFDVTPFADENEHILYAKVEDAEGNIGESEKLNVVITEYPGWRIYNFDFFNIPFGITHSPTLAPIAIDENGVIVIGSGWHYNGFFIFDPSTHDLQHFTMENSPIPSNDVADIKYIGDGRIILASFNQIIQYSFSLNRWIYSITLPTMYEDHYSDIMTIAVDKDYNVWAGTYASGLFLYKGTVLEKWYKYDEIPSSQIFDLVVTNDNRIFAGTGWGGVFSIRNDIINSYDYFSDDAGDYFCIVIDSTNTIWTGKNGFAHKYDGNNWETINITNIHGYFNPMLVTKNGLLITYGFDRYSIDKKTNILSYDGNNWTLWNNTDSPFTSANDNLRLSRKSLAEAPNGDIWMVAGGKLMRYRPSLGGYP